MKFPVLILSACLACSGGCERSDSDSGRPPDWPTGMTPGPGTTPLAPQATPAPEPPPAPATAPHEP